MLASHWSTPSILAYHWSMPSILIYDWSTLCCSCAPGHHLDRDGRHCSELHPCDTWGACSQLCRRVSRARHKCYCHPGHVLQPDKFSCKSRDPSQPRIVFSTRHSAANRLIGEGPY